MEYQELLHRDNIQALCRQTTVSLEEFPDDFSSICTPVDAWFLWRPNLADEADNHIIELAIAANADYIVTNNLKDFAQPELLHAGYEIISPQQLLRRARS